ncbi:uncharacterized protein LOC129981115 isoform X1 [Argiope bruennichi]|uniref:Uncharacterized protein n=1 Tax=Argiope bruennichi TaxID=94029 RepID=A0A8T0G0R1_ARGBR|nr:uncharacterized protein LOC129981115 isoform X1 [Argiope bruennichi]KAF8796927.1 hypothetical protein HNY73_001255 [Argiope bruennichi]
MNFNFVPSVVHMASVKVVSNLLQNSEIGKVLNDDMRMLNPLHCSRRDRRDQWELTKMKILEKLPFLPSFISEEVGKIIHPMHNEVMLWLNDHNLYLSHLQGQFYVDYSLFCWKTTGMIDREQTAKKIVHSENFDISHRFIIACTYFFMDEILSLWDAMQESGIRISGRQINSAVNLWTKLLAEENAKSMEELIKDYFNPAQIRQPRILLRLSSYFRFLPLEYRMGYFLNDGFGVQADDFYLCLYQMNESECFEFFRAKPVFVLQRFLKWPFQSVFIKLATDISRHMVFTDFKAILDHIFNDFILEGYNYFELFKEFWNIIPDHYQSEIRKDETKFQIWKLILNCDSKKPTSEFFETLDQFHFQ